MKNIILIFSLLISFYANSQVLGYEDIAVLLSGENTQGTARTMAMKGAFGALGGDLSTLSINPAGAAIFTSSIAAITLGNNHTNLTTDFYGTLTQNSFDKFNVSQVGGLLLFENNDSSSKYRRIAVGINLNTLNNFHNEWTASGLITPTWIDNPTDSSIEYTQIASQKYLNVTGGNYTQLNFSFATQYGKSLFLGASFNTYDMAFNERGERMEVASDGGGNTVDAYEYFWQEVNGNGFSFSTGIIFKATQNLRLGLSYSSPTWFELNEESNMFAEDEDDFVGYYDIIYSNEEASYTNSYNKVLAYNYRLQTPGKVTGSVAYIFGEKGLISADLTRKNFNGLQLSPNFEFDYENDNLQALLSSTYQINLGTEWRFKKISFRGGYSYEQTPYTQALDTDNKRGYALGLGYNFGSVSLDIAYDYHEQTDYYNFYPEFNWVRGAELSKNNDKIMATLAYKF